jgi:signal transduction histidine kinase
VGAARLAGAVRRRPRGSAVSPDQRFLGILDTSPFRIAIAYSIAFACGAALLIGGVDFAVSRVVDSSTDNLIDAEVQGLREQVLVLSRNDFIELIEQRSQDQDVRGAVYLMVDPELRPVAGNVPAWPTKPDSDDGKWIQFKVAVPFGDETREHEMRARRFKLPGGYNMLVGHDVQERQDVKNLMMRGLIAAVVLTLLLGLGGGFWMGRRILAQAGAISVVATQIMRGDLSQRLPVRDADDEINTLAREINTMLDRIEQLTLGMRTVLDSAAHDLRTPLNRLQSTAEGAMTQVTPGSPERRVLERVSVEVDHMRSTLDALLRIALAETGTVAREAVDLSELVGSMVELYAPVSEERGIKLESAVAAGAEVQGSRQLLAQALANLLDNAIKFTPEGGRIRVCLSTPAAGPEVMVEDNGPGIPADKREIVLGRRVRLDQARKVPGSGLGLSLVSAVTKLHGARLVLDDAAPGLRVSLKFLGG